jgi:MFS family permease
MYVAEIAEKSIRGTLCSLFQFQITCGILFVFILGAFNSPQKTSLICAFVPVIFLILVYFTSETPNYLVRKRQHDEAIECVMKFRAKNYEPIVEITELEKEDEVRRTEDIKSALMKKSSQKAIKIGLGLMFFQQLSGINAVIFYTSTIFEDANIDIKPEYATIIVGVIQIIATFGATATIDKVGRKALLIISGIFMSLCTLTLGIFYAVKQVDNESVSEHGHVPLIALCIFIIAFSLGYGPVSDI